MFFLKEIYLFLVFFRFFFSFFCFLEVFLCFFFFFFDFPSSSESDDESEESDPLESSVSLEEEDLCLFLSFLAKTNKKHQTLDLGSTSNSYNEPSVIAITYKAKVPNQCGSLPLPNF